LDITLNRESRENKHEMPLILIHAISWCMSFIYY